MDKEMREGVEEWCEAKQVGKEEEKEARQDYIRREIEWRMECAFFEMRALMRDRRS